MTHIANQLPLHGVHLVEASAGTGKTYTIATLFVRLLILRELDVSQILVVTYTRAATAELQDRIRRRLLETAASWNRPTPPSDPVLSALWHARSSAQRKQDVTRLKLALADYDRANISTIHGYCQRVLTEHAFDSQVTLAPELISDERHALQEVVNDYWAQRVYNAEPFLLDALKPGTLLKNLHKLARDTVHQRGATITPERSQLLPPPSMDSFLSAKRAFAEAWRSHGAEAIRTIATCPGIHQNTYKSERVSQLWPRLIGDYLHAAAIEPPKEVARLGATALADGMTKAFKHAPPKIALSAEADALVVAAEAIMHAAEAWKQDLKLGLIEHARAELDRRKREQQRVSFDDLLRQLSDALLGESGDHLARALRRSYPVALVDEFQDTDPVQYTAFARIYANDDRCALYLIGDPKQAIYRFRGADIFAYMDAARAASDHAWQLVANYRSDPSLIRAVNTFFAQRPQPFFYDAISFEPAEPAPDARDRLKGASTWCKPLCMLQLPTEGEKPLERNEAEQRTSTQVARHIGHMLAAGLTIQTSDGERAVEPRDVAVLCRTNQQTALVQQALRELRIPTARDGDSSVFDTITALELERLLDAVAQPDDGTKLRVALSTALLGLDAQQVLALDNDDVDHGGSAAWEQWVIRMRHWNALWLARGLMPMLQDLLAAATVHRRALSWVDGERRLTDLMHLAELLQREASDRHVGPLALVQWLKLLRIDDTARTELASDEMQIRLESDAHAVKLTTVHRSKGLEYPIVYCPFLWQAPGKWPTKEDALIFHAKQTADSVMIDVNVDRNASHLVLHKEESLAEELRLAYVALTRAKHRCVVAWGHFAGLQESALGYLIDQAPPPRDGKDQSKKTDKSDARAGQARHLAALVAACPDAIAVEPGTLAAPAGYRASPLDRRTPLTARTRTRKLPPGLRVTSFTRLVEQEAALGRDVEAGYDHDSFLHAQIAAPGALDRRGAPLIALADVPSSADVGLLVHDVLEHCSFDAEARPELRARLSQIAPRHGMQAHVDVLDAALSAALDAPLGPGALGFRLADIAAHDRVVEMEIIFPIRHGLTAHAIANAIDRHDPTLTTARYRESLRALGFRAFAGYLRGYIDLCFRHDDRYYVADYKTNHLGRTVDDYAEPDMQQAMAEHHYDLQALIYSLALHRHLSLRDRGYDYDRNFGGYVYAFVRGMSPAHPVGTGVFHRRPTRALMDELSRLLEVEA